MTRKIKKIVPVIPTAAFTGEEKTRSGEHPDPTGQILHKDVLNVLINEIQPLDFIVLIRPESKVLIKEYNAIMEAYKTDNEKLQQKLNKPKGKEETTRTAELEVLLKGIKKGIKQKHYVVCMIIELLKIAANSKWNLCKCYDYVYIYNGAFWKQLSECDLKYFLGEVAIKFGYPEIDALHHRFKDELLKQFVTQAHLPTPEHDKEKVIINLQNGTFEFIGDKWKLRAFDPKDFLTYQLPFGYDVKATCPKFDSYLLKVIPDKDSRLILQEFSGFIFTKLNLEKCLVLTGSGSNGKSVFFNILTALLGSENTLTYTMGLFNDEFKRAKLTDVLLNYSSEKGHDLNVDTFKALISGEPLQAREPFGRSFTIHNKVRFIMNCNELPGVTDSTDAYYRRYLIVPFDVKIPESERDINLANNIIAEELPGVFNWLLDGLVRIVLQKAFTQSEKVNKAHSEFKRQGDNISLFIDELNFNPGNDEKKPLADLFCQYKKFCSDDNYKALGKNKFSQKVESLGFESTRLNDGSKAFFTGV